MSYNVSLRNKCHVLDFSSYFMHKSFLHCMQHYLNLFFSIFAVDTNNELTLKHGSSQDGYCKLVSSSHRTGVVTIAGTAPVLWLRWCSLMRST